MFLSIRSQFIIGTSFVYFRLLLKTFIVENLFLKLQRSVFNCWIFKYKSRNAQRSCLIYTFFFKFLKYLCNLNSISDFFTTFLRKINPYFPYNFSKNTTNYSKFQIDANNHFYSIFRYLFQ